MALALLAACGGGGDAATPPSAEAVTPVPIPGIPGMAPPGAPVGYDTVDQSTVYSGVPTERFIVVRDAPTWTALWMQYTANVMPSPPAPAVDFSSKMVVAVFLGARPSGCYTATITRVTQDNSNTSVEFSERTPQPSDGCIAAITYPSHIVTVPAASGAVQFIRI